MCGWWHGSGCGGGGGLGGGGGFEDFVVGVGALAMGGV